MASDQGDIRWWRAWYAGPIFVSAGAWMAVLASLAPEGTGPGVTCDELYHTWTAKRQVWALERYGLDFFTQPVVEQVFPFRPEGPPVHPPLVHWVLGLVHRLVDSAPDQPRAVSILGARLGGAIGYGLLVLLVGLWTARQAGALAGTSAGLACALMPRVFAHGHLAALEIWTALSLLGAALAAGWAETSSRGLTRLRWMAAGAAWGLALLTRFHAFLLGPVVVGWLLLREKRPWLPNGLFWQKVLLWTATAWGVFFIGWPWLWYSPWEHLRLYLASATQRQPIHVYYLGQVWQDWEVPWHYPWVMFGATVPVGLLAMGLLGLWRVGRLWRQQPQWGLGAALAGAGLALFSWPGVPVYDGERLFLFVYPIWAILVGLGCQWLEEVLLRWLRPNGASPTQGFSRRLPTAAHHPNDVLLYLFSGKAPFRWLSVPPHSLVGGMVLAGVALQGVGLVLYHPCQLSYYNLLVGGLAGAERLGLEVNYWADGLREPLLAEAAAQAPGQQVFLAPHLAPFQAPGIAISSPALAEGHVELVGWDPTVHAGGTALGISSPNQPTIPPCRWFIVYHRKADLAIVEPLLAHGEVVAEYCVRGVWLARLVKVPAQ